MSWQATSAVQHLTADTGITSSEKLVLLVLADRHNADVGYAWPRVSRIAAETCLSERHVRKLLASLETKGFIRREWRFTEHGQTSSAYYLTFLEGQELDPDAAEQPVAGPETGEKTDGSPSVKELAEDLTSAVGELAGDLDPTPQNADILAEEVTEVVAAWEEEYDLSPKDVKRLVVAAVIGAARTWWASKEGDRYLAQLTHKEPDRYGEILRWVAAASNADNPVAYVGGCSKKQAA